MKSGSFIKPLDFIAWETPLLEVRGCPHPGMAQPVFDREAAKGLSSSEIRERWPRVFQHCEQCGLTVVAYASYEHYLSGDW